MVIVYHHPWWEIEDPAYRQGLQDQYDREVTPAHLLWNASGSVVGKSDAGDDVLVALAEGRFAIVHLTWTSNAGGSAWPAATIYETAEAISKEIADQHEEYL